MRCISVERRPSGSIEHAVDPLLDGSPKPAFTE
jgi:hypothetical protein